MKKKIVSLIMVLSIVIQIISTMAVYAGGNSYLTGFEGE